jgi:tripartite-type tricarboxylate transporter receptor subunit TctC
MLAVSVRSAVVAFFAFLLAWPQAGHAADDYYQGKRLTVLINYAAGGPTDIEGRLFAKHVAKYLGGKPSVIVQNMDGGGGLIGVNYLGEVGPKDGTMVGYFTGTAWAAISEAEHFHADYKSYEFVAYQPGTTVYFMRRDVPPGMKEATDLAKAKGVIAGGLGAANSKDLLIRLTLDMLGVDYRYVTGYQSSTRARHALEQGEVNLYSESPPSYRAVIEPGLVKNGTVIPLFYDPGWNGQSFRVPKQVADLPLLPYQELYKKIKGGLPSGQLWEAYLSILTVNSGMQRLIVLPPKAPQEALDALRAAVRKLNDDKAFADDALKAVGFVPEYEAGPDTGREVRQALTTKPEVRAFLKDYIAKGKR